MIALQYERETFEYQKLTDLLTKQVQFYSSIIKTTRDDPQYYRVGYYGLAYPHNIRNKVLTILLRLVVTICNRHHLQSSPSAIITIFNHHHLQQSSSSIIAIANHHHLQSSSPSVIIVISNNHYLQSSLSPKNHHHLQSSLYGVPCIPF